MRPLDDDAKALLTAIAALGLPPLGTVSAAEMRSLRRQRAPAPALGPHIYLVKDLQIPSRAGTVIAARLYRPSQEARPLVIFFHGGGWTFGGVEQSDASTRRLAEATQCCILSVEYRLAPEHPFPAAFEDAWAACEWASTHSRELSGTGGPIILAGESAGANLSAAVALAFMQAGRPLAGQILSCPLVVAGEEGLAGTMTDHHFPTATDVAWFLDQYLPTASDRLDLRFAPGHARLLAGVAPAFIATAGHDLLRGQGETYARRLRAAGIKVVERCYEGAFHGILELASQTTAAASLRADIRAFIYDTIGKA